LNKLNNKKEPLPLTKGVFHAGFSPISQLIGFGDTAYRGDRNFVPIPRAKHTPSRYGQVKKTTQRNDTVKRTT